MPSTKEERPGSRTGALKIDADETSTNVESVSDGADEVPLVFDVAAQLDYLGTLHDYPAADTIETAGSRVGRNNYPALVAGLHYDGLLTPGAAARVVPSAWSLAEHPMRLLDAAEWATLYATAGYTIDGDPAPRPTSVPRLYRGAVPGHADGWSWTDNPAVAEWFADRPHNQGRGRVYELEPPPAALLARIVSLRPGEVEHVVDTRGLEIGGGRHE